MVTQIVSTKLSAPEFLVRSMRIKRNERYKENYAARRNVLPRAEVERRVKLNEEYPDARIPTFEGVGRRTFNAARFYAKAPEERKRNARIFADEVIVAE